MMTKYLLFIAALILIGCSKQYFETGMLAEKQEQPKQSQVVNIQSLTEQAKWGSGEAYLKLARCYHDGVGVKRDFVGMLCMAALAQQHGAVGGLDEFVKSLPASEYKATFDALTHILDRKYDKAHALADSLMGKGCAEGYAVKGILALEHRDTTEFRRLSIMAAEMGSTFGELLLCVKDWKDSLEFDITRLILLSDRIPLANLMLAAHYANLTNSEKNYDKMASNFFMRADECGLLGKKNARWLLNYYKNGGIRTIDDEDFARIKKLAGED